MAFNPYNIPFYKAIKLFEEENYKEAFEIFLALAEKTNLPAFYYAKHILDKKLIEEPKEASDFLRTLDDHLEQIPTNEKPNSWLKASITIIEFNKTIKGNEKKKTLETLGSFTRVAPNAAVFVLKHYQQNKDGIVQKINYAKKIKELIFDIYNQCDILSIYSLKSEVENANKQLNPSIPDDMLVHFNQEIATLEQRGALAYKTPSGTMERFITKLYTSESSEAYKVDLERMYRWQKRAAYMGNKELQCLFSKPNERNNRSKEEALQWEYVTILNYRIFTKDLLELGVKFFAGSETIKENYNLAYFFLKSGLQSKLDGEFAPSKVLLGSAYLSYGKIIEEGYGAAPKSDVQAIEFYKKSLELNIATAAHNIGIFYENGKGGCKKDHNAALDYYHKAIKLYSEKDISLNEERFSNLNCCIGRLHENGKYGVKQDFKLALEYYKIAATYQDKEAIFRIAIFEYTGVSIPENKEKALQDIMNIAEQGHTDAAIFLGEIYYSHKQQDLLKQPKLLQRIIKYLELARKSNYRAETLLGAILHLTSKSDKDFRVAKSHILQGANFGDPLALLRIGNFYEHGCPELNIDINPKLAYEYYAGAAGMRHREGLNNVGYCFARGFGVKQDREKAIFAYKKAIERGSKMAGYGLYCLQYDKQGTKESQKENLEYLLLAEETNDEDVLFEIGAHYFSGKFLEKSRKKAYSYFERAAKLGHPKAAENYALLKFKKYFKTGEIFFKENQTHLLEILNCSVQKGHTKGIFLRSMLELLMNHSKISDIIPKLQLALQKKPYNPVKIAVEYLSKHPNVGAFDCFYLFLGIDPTPYIENIKKILNQNIVDQDFKQIQEKLLIDHSDSKVEKDQKINEDALKQSESLNLNEHKKISNVDKYKNPNDLKPEPSKNGHVLSFTQNKKTERLEAEIEIFIDPKNKKRVNISDFKRLFGKILIQSGTRGEIKPSGGGSNIRFKAEQRIPGQKSLHFSFHPRHSKRHGTGSSYDPKRAISLSNELKNALVLLKQNKS